jgi:hypothetical protein
VCHLQVFAHTPPPLDHRRLYKLLLQHAVPHTFCRALRLRCAFSLVLRSRADIHPTALLRPVHRPPANFDTPSSCAVA